MSKTCPACTQPATGRFCAHCGVSLEGGAQCADCGHEIPVGGRFCNQCGAATPATRAVLAESGAGRGSNLPWYITGAALVVLGGVLLAPQLRKDEPAAVAATAPAAAPFAGGAAGPAGDARSVDLSSMTPREQADRLFNRVMQNVSGGDSAQAKAFLPMAIAAYGNVPDLDLDGRYHLSVLHLVGGDAQAARAEAGAILERDANHLFGLFTAAQAEQALGNQAAARELFARFLDRYDAELARKLPEYQDHEPALPSMVEEAKRVAGR